MEATSLQNLELAYSQFSLNKGIHEDNQNSKDKHKDPEKVVGEKNSSIDGGYAWVVLAAVFLSFFMLSAWQGTSTLAYSLIITRYGMTATAAGLVFSLQSTIRMFSSPFVSFMYHFIQHRTVGITGGLLFSVGLMAYAYAPSPWMLYLAYSVVSAIGANMLILTLFVIIPVYFEKKRAKAMAIALCGHDCGVMLFSNPVALAYERLGYLMTVSLCACLSMQSCIAAAFLRPINSSRLTNVVMEEKTKEHSHNKEENSEDLSVKTSKSQAWLSNTGLVLLCDFKYLTLIMLNASNFGVIGCSNIYLSGLVQETCGLTSSDIALLVALASGFKIVGKIVSGIAFDLNFIKTRRMSLYVLLLIMQGLLYFSLQYCRTMVSFSITWCLFSGVTFAAHAQQVTLFCDILAKEQLANGIAIGRVFQGITLLTYPVIVGYLKDTLGSYTYGCTVLGTMHTSLCVLYIFIFKCRERCQA